MFCKKINRSSAAKQRVKLVLMHTDATGGSITRQQADSVLVAMSK